MVGLRQTFPSHGSLDARAREALSEAATVVESQRARELDLRREVRRAYYEYYQAEREYLVHLEHVELESRIVELARAHYQVGRGSQQDVLRAIVDLSRLHSEIAAI